MNNSSNVEEGSKILNLDNLNTASIISTNTDSIATTTIHQQSNEEKTIKVDDTNLAQSKIIDNLTIFQETMITMISMIQHRTKLL